MRFSKFIVAGILVLNTAFTAVVLWLFFYLGTEPTALIAAWFAFTTGELFSLASIKKREVEKDDNGNKPKI